MAGPQDQRNYTRWSFLFSDNHAEYFSIFNTISELKKKKSTNL